MFQDYLTSAVPEKTSGRMTFFFQILKQSECAAVVAGLSLHLRPDLPVHHGVGITQVVNQSINSTINQSKNS